MKFVYIAGPYMDKAKKHDYTGYFEIDANIRHALQAAAAFAVAGVGYFCPHQHSAHMEVITPSVPPAFWYELDNKFLESCDAILMLPGWEESSGSKKELGLAKQLDLNVFYHVNDAIFWAQAREAVELYRA